jgi:hypothetical protein
MGPKLTRKFTFTEVNKVQQIVNPFEIIVADEYGMDFDKVH